MIEELVMNEVYWINTSHEKDRDYVYQGMRWEEHMFTRDGAIRDTMRITLVKPEFTHVEGKRVTIVDDTYRIDAISKDEKPEEYERLQRLWRLKTT